MKFHKQTISVLSVAATIAIQALAPTRVEPAEPAKQSVLMEIDWKELQEKKQLKAGEVVADEGSRKGPLKVTSPLQAASADGATVPLLEIEAPTISKRVYMLAGEIRYQDVEGAAFIEMWNFFSDGSKYFTRTLASTGPLKSLQGSSEWRSTKIPFELAEGPNAARPNRLAVNVVFPGKGTVWLSNFTLSEFDTLQQAVAVPGAWWSDAAGGLIGGIGGTLFGVLSAFFGVFAARGAARNMVIGGTVAGIVLGIALLATGVVAVVLKQPYGVFYPLMLGGGLCLVLGTVGLFVFRHRYSQLELRRMEALDAGR